MFRPILRPRPSARCDGKNGGSDDGRMGRSRGGLTTKIHAVVDAEWRPVALDLVAGQAHDGKAAESLPDLLGDGDILLADAGYGLSAPFR